MGIVITITNVPFGYAHFYEKYGRQGIRKCVPTYSVHATCPGLELLEFRVTRITSASVFKNSMIPECPPNTPGKPYHGTLRDDNGRGLRIQLYEPECGTDSLRGTGTEIRKVIQIHKGPGRSDGCFMIGGGKRGFRKFERWLRRALILDPQPDIKVSVEPY